MKDAAAFDIEGLVKGYPRGTAWHCTFYTPAGRQRKDAIKALQDFLTEDFAKN